MIRFEHPSWLYLLIGVPFLLLFIAFLYYKKRKVLRSFVQDHLFLRLVPEYSKGKPIIKYTLLILSFVFLVFAMANPQVGMSVTQGERSGVDIMVCLDISRSMLAEDIKPNRLMRAKQGINRLIDDLKTDRIGLVVFAGTSFVQLPITTDYGIAKTFVDLVHPEMIATQGTAIGDALQKSLSGLVTEKEPEGKGKTIIVISDGENHEDDAIAAAKEARQKGVVVHTIGIGSLEGTLIPEFKNGQKVGFKKDRSGSLVLTRLNEQLLTEIAQAGGGIYLHTANIDSGLKTLVNQLNSMEKRQYEKESFDEYEDWFPYLLIMAIFCLVLELLIYARRHKYLNVSFLFSKIKHRKS